MQYCVLFCKGFNMKITLKPSLYFALCILSTALMLVYTIEASVGQNPDKPVIKHFIEVAQTDNKEIIELLLEKQADVHVTNTDHTTPLHSAAQCGHTRVIEALL